MQNTQYATFIVPQEANLALTELIQRGASNNDVVIIGRNSYRDPAFDAGETRLDVYEPIRLEPDLPLEPSIQPDPFGNEPGEVWLVDQMRYPGDLAEGLKQLGFPRETAYSLENSVLEGCAILILRTPSGPVDESQVHQVINRFHGKQLVPQRANPYLG